ncbi:MAG TPA: hypothetical protein VNY73_05450 [Bacteroidia bacterium]|nr:hypothetical protein [Bacteroidia bacterium]
MNPATGKTYKGLNYYSFGMVMPGRQYTSTNYRYGFGGQEKDDEIAGNGSITTASFWEYDTRLGRRWNIDPTVKPWESGYSSFSNSPVIQIDPNGNTDYYNSKGHWLGTDGIDNGETRLVLKKSTAKVIKKATKENMVISMNENYYRDIVNPLSPNEIKAGEKAYKDTEKDGKEHGYAAGKTPNGDVVTEEEKAGASDKINPYDAIRKVKSDGNENLYDAHTHPDSYTVTNGGSGVVASVPEPSPDDGTGNGDLPVRDKNEKEYGYSRPSLVLGYEQSFKKDPNTGDVTRTDDTRTVGFYDSKGLRGKLSWSQLKKASGKIDADQAKRRPK